MPPPPHKTRLTRPPPHQQEYFISGFHIVLPLLSSELHLAPAAQTWPSSVFTLAASACLLPLGRLSDLRGAHPVFAAGLAWAALSCLAAGFCRSYAALVACRALTGVGAAAFLPAGITLIGKTYRPGPRKNLVFALYGAFAPLGFFAGILLGGVAGQFLDWRWYFWIGAAVMAVICAAGVWAVPRDLCRNVPEGAPGMDWWGVVTVVPGVVLLVYGITESSQAARGWASPQIIATVVAGACFLAAAVYVEGWVATDPLLPADLFAPPYMKRLVAGLFLAYGAFGLFLFYSSFYLEVVLGKSPLQTAVWYIPMVGCGLVLGAVGGLTLHRLPGRVLLVLSGLGFVVACLLFALMPEDPNYWAWVMPAMIASSVGIDIAFTVSNVFITTNLPLKRQGLAGALINSTLFLGISVLLGFGNVAVAHTSHLPLRENYQVAFWLAVGVAGAALWIFAFIDLGQAKSQLTLEEREQIDMQNRQGSKQLSQPPASV
ncbi:Major facilitator superfamily domain, general substrate transporter [Cordyceps fumosorosea ARSEF 2679]|uniref:Major facilitator superfamily domain, general substrate transporter n=1 Tax=Cordyceps fumosorosea (strain ARSEF 2679) TaxID=1081104 RepID=A0A168CPB4_CORFA|nr:Major facilitator superfamily domain, general substrate transporter [Cordyceps fumosorosea ARSEF 2679]OAA71626.1 Major facilitator superfamily domain, general substrate transporter [Cordyceps fumosorosea ARSEF 2679]